MDFWSRLVGSGKQKQTASSAANTPAQRLQRCRRAYAPIAQLCSRPQVTAADSAALNQLRTSLHQLTALLREETRTPAPHLCLSFVASNQIYSVIARAASASQNDVVIKGAIDVFSILIDSEEEDFLASRVFAKSLVRFAARATHIGRNTETDLIELLFGVAAKLRVQPDILPVWFNPQTLPHGGDTPPEAEKKDFVGTTRKDDFPLCYLLIDRIHHEGRTGDFARTAMLYVFEAVSHSPELEDWIIRSDLPTLMASGLGALYSQLSRELSLRHDNDHLPLMLALSDYTDLPPSTQDAENIFSTSHAKHVSTFISHLAFWQDCLEHCKSEDVKQTLLDHFRVLFLQQLLYPSLLQSSDTDRGSSVAVLTYIANILEALDHPDLVRMILQYLLAIPDSTPDSMQTTAPSAPSMTRRQSSLTVLDGLSSDEERVDPNLFSLVDLILNGVRSPNPQTVIAALKLSSVLLNRHTTYAVSTLIKAGPLSRKASRRIAGALAVETESLITAAASLSYKESLNDAYATALQDILPPLEVQFVQQADPKSTAEVEVALSPNDPLMSAIYTLFASFFTNGVDVNLSLTESVIQLALRSHVSLRGWLAADPSTYIFDETVQDDSAIDVEYMDEEEMLAFQALKQAHRRPRWTRENMPMLHTILQELQTQIESLRRSVTNIDVLITKRIEILSGIEKEDPVTPTRLSMDSGADSNSRKRDISPFVLTENPRLSSPVRSPASSRVREIMGSPKRWIESPGRLTPGSISPARLNMGSAFPARSSSLRRADQSLEPGVFLPPPAESDDSDNPATVSDGRRPSPSAREPEAETLQRVLVFQRGRDASDQVFRFIAPESAMAQPETAGDYEQRSASTTHVLTNVVILHFFLLELVAVLQTRAVMFDEVVFA